MATLATDGLIVNTNENVCKSTGNLFTIRRCNFLTNLRRVLQENSFTLLPGNLDVRH